MKNEINKLIENLTIVNIDETFEAYESICKRAPRIRIMRREITAADVECAEIYAALESLKKSIQAKLNETYPKGEIEA